MHFLRPFGTILLVLVSLLQAGCSNPWTDEVLLHDGRIIYVHRSVSMERRTNLGAGQFPMSVPVLYNLQTANPNTQNRITWESSDKFLLPVSIDFVGDDSFLVLSLPGSHELNKKYGCPATPFIFLRHRPGGDWAVIEKLEFPPFQMQANLSLNYHPYFMTRDLPYDLLSKDQRQRLANLPSNLKFGFQTIESIRHWNSVAEKHGHFQIDIPRDRSEWKSKGSMRGC